MKDEELLISENEIFESKIRIPFEAKSIIFKSNQKRFGLTQIKSILNFMIIARKKYKLSIFPVKIKLGECIFEDKLSYIMLEILLEYLIREEQIVCDLEFKCNHNIFNEGIKTSFLRFINNKIDPAFISKKNRSAISFSHYRKIISMDTYDIATISRTVQDIDTFLKTHQVQEEYRSAVSDVIGELVDNALDHSNSDCLLDLDITNDYVKRDDKDNSQYCGVNIVILNFSDILLGNNIKEKLSNNSIETLGKRYAELNKAYKYHSRTFGGNYDEQSFFAIAAFQHKISSRNSSTGGTGLTCLIKTLEEKSDAYNCYVITGNKKIHFKKEFLIYDEDEWIGFNESCNFLSDLPNKNIISKSPFFFPGTAYNLNFVLKREVKDEHPENNT